jgi:uncharacterized protein
LKLTATALFVFCVRLVLTTVPAHAQSGLIHVPQMSAPVAGVASVLTQTQRDLPIAQIGDAAKRTGSLLRAVVVDRTDPGRIEDFSRRVFASWKLGLKGIDDGVLLVLSVNDESRRLHIEVRHWLREMIDNAFSDRLFAPDLRPVLEQTGAGKTLEKAMSNVTAPMLDANIKEPLSNSQAREAATGRLLWGSLAQIVLLLVTNMLMKRRIWLKTRLAFIAVLSCAATAIYIWAAGNVWWAYSGAIWIGIALVMIWKNWSKVTAPSNMQEAEWAPEPPPALSSAIPEEGKAWRHIPLVDRSGKDRRGFVAEDHVPVHVGLPIMVPLHFMAAAIAAAVGAINGPDMTISAVAGVGWWILASTIFTQLTRRHGLVHAARKRRLGSRRRYDGDASSDLGSDYGGSWNRRPGGPSVDNGTGSSQ